LAVLFYFGNSLSALGQSIIAPEKPLRASAPVPLPTPAPVPSSEHATTPAAKPLGTGPAHAYLFRGLMNIFSLGMDDLAQKIERLGIAANVYNHSEWREVADEIASKYKAGNHGPIILIGHSLGADAVMLMGEYLGERGVPVALVVPFDGTRSLNASGNIARVMNITQRDYAYMRRGYGFRGELANVDVSSDESIGHISIDKSARLHALVLNKIVSVVGKGGVAGEAANTFPSSSKPVSEPLTSGVSAKLESVPPVSHAPLNPPTALASGLGGAITARGPASTGAVASSSVPLEYQPLGQ
jgi:pimeloyl-ACP methyl ester carboxylesterase